MSRFEKICEALESAESIEMKLYRNKVRDSLHGNLQVIREEMLEEDRFPFLGKWLTREEIALAQEFEKKGKFTKLVLVIFIYILLMGLSFLFGFLVWQATG